MQDKPTFLERSTHPTLNAKEHQENTSTFDIPCSIFCGLNSDIKTANLQTPGVKCVPLSAARGGEFVDGHYLRYFFKAVIAHLA